MPLTFTGRLVTRDGGHPSLLDIAIGMSRQPRFGGQTRTWWSVLDHSLFADDLLRAGHGSEPFLAETTDSMRPWRLAVLLHDAHEALTGDIPTPLKTDSMRHLQEDLDRSIFDAYFPGGYYNGYRRQVVEQIVKKIDRRALAAEAYNFLPHGTEVLQRHFPEPDHIALDTLRYYMGYTFAANPPLSACPTEHPTVQEYLRRMLELL